MRVALSNAGATAMTVWVEPWCDELELPVRSTLSFEPDEVTTALPELEMVDGRLVIWAGGPGTATVTIDERVQDTGSRTITLAPELFDRPIKATMTILFRGFPRTRLGGAPIGDQSWWLRLLTWLRLR